HERRMVTLRAEGHAQIRLVRGNPALRAESGGRSNYTALLVAGGFARLVFAVATAAARGVHERAEDLVLHRAPALVVALGDAGDGLDRIHADDGLHLLAQFALLRTEQLHALLQVAAEHVLQVAAVGADDLREEVAAHHRVDSMFLLGNHL